MRDFEAYWGAGAALNAGVNPFDRTIWNFERTVPGADATRDEVLPFVGPPFTLPLWGLFARLTYSAAARIWLSALAVCVLTLAVIVARAGRASSLPTFAAALALAVTFGPVTSDIALGQVALFAFTCAAVVTVVAPLPWRTAASLFAFAQPNVAFGLLSQLGRNRTTVAMTIAAAAAYAIGTAAYGWRWPIVYATALAAHAGAERLSLIQMTPGAIAYGAGLSASAASVVALLTALPALAAAFVIARAIADPFARFAAVAALAPFVSTFFHEHDFVVAYAAAGWCAARARGSVRSVALAATLLVAVDWLGLAQRPTGLLQSALLAAAAACAFQALGDGNEMRANLGALAAIAGVFAIAAWLALTHPAPVWPDTLGNFHAAAGESIATLWYAEQQRAGLLTPNSVWAFLRLLPLTGCALLASSVYAATITKRDTD